MQTSAISQAVARVRARQWMVNLAQCWHLFFFILATTYAVALLATRLFGLWPNVLTPVTLAAVPLAALGLAMLFHRRPAMKDGARAIDQRMETRDLFLTATLIESALGDYKPLVLQQAEAQAQGVEPARVVEYRWARGAAQVAAASAALLAGIYFLPQLDPFGKEKERRNLAQREKQLEEGRKATAARAALLQQKKIEAEHSPAVEQALTELKQAFQQMKPNEREQNAQRLAEQQKDLGQMWRKMSEEKLKSSAQNNPMGQKFGGDLQKISQWKEQLEKGETTDMKRELETLRKKVEELTQMKDSPEKEKLAQEVKKDLKAMTDFISQNTSSQAAKDALARAAEQMDLAKLPGLSEQALKAAGESLKLSEQELDQLAQAARDLNSLEDALRTIQQAKALNNGEGKSDGQCKGGNCDKCGGAGCAGSGMDYAKLYEQMMQGQGRGQGDGPGQGQGPGMGGPGQGQGGQATENEAVSSGFKPEQSKSALTAGKTLLEWKTKGLGERGEAKLDYAKQVQAVKQGVSEAILAEQIPPGYHENIQKYFDSLQETPAPAVK